MTKKILLSVAASALLTTSAFAGTMNTDSGHSKITQESYLQNGMDVINFSSFKYVAQIGGSGSINTPLVKIDISDIEIPRYGAGTHTATSGDNTSERFDEHGRGLLLSSIAQNIAIGSTVANDQKNDWEDHFQGLWLIDVDPSGNIIGTGIPFNDINTESGKVYLNFTGSSLDTLINGHTYVMSTQPNAVAEVNIDFKYVKDNQKMSLNVYSLSVDPTLVQDSASLSYITTFPPQFRVNCVRKFDGLINFENDRATFVNPEHGDRIELDAAFGARLENDGSQNGTNISNDTVIDRDRMIFEVYNSRDAASDTRYMGGHGTEFTFDVNNNNNLFSPAGGAGEWDYNLKILPGETAAKDNNSTLTDTHLNGAPALTGIVAFAANTFTLTHPLANPIPTGLTAYQLDLVSLDGNTPIRPVVFSNPTVDLEGGLTPNNIDTEDTASQTEVLHGGLAANTEGDITSNYITNSTLDSGTGTTDSFDASIIGLAGAAIARAGAFGRGDSDDVIVPQMDGSNTSNDVGEWMDHAYMAQIPATIAHADLKNKIYITNRSCVPVTPIFKLVLDGVVTKVTDVTPRNETETAIARDTQEVYNLADIITKAGTASTGTYSLEVILPGIAEDFYIYAQSKNTVINQFKDLPVYNTSNRD